MFTIDRRPTCADGTREMTRDELKEYLGEHVQYEFSMLQVCAASLHQFNPELIAQFGIAVHGQIHGADYAQAVKNVWTEGFVVHLRNAIDFFYERDSQHKPKKDDVVADHFYPGMKRPKNFPPISESLRRARVRSDKELAHLTSGRQSRGAPGKPWAFMQLLTEIGDLLATFKKLCDPELLNSRMAGLKLLNSTEYTGDR